MTIDSSWHTWLSLARSALVLSGPVARLNPPFRLAFDGSGDVLTTNLGSGTVRRMAPRTCAARRAAELDTYRSALEHAQRRAR